MFNRFKKDISKYYKYSIISAKAQLKAEVANSYLNWIWWILDPLCFMLIYSFIFGYVFDAREPSFTIFLFIGLSMWTFFSKTISQSVKIVKNNKAIVSKVYIPKYILILTKIWVNGFKLLITFSIVVIMIFAYRVQLTYNVLYSIPIVVIMGLFTFGCACFLLHYGVYVEDLSNVISIVLRFAFYLTGIFYNIEKRIPQWGALLNEVNPMAFLITSMRECLIYGQTPDIKLLTAWFAISLGVAVLGVRKIYKEENNYVKAI